jgi:hypothetical protein
MRVHSVLIKINLSFPEKSTRSKGKDEATFIGVLKKHLYSREVVPQKQASLL